jgi:leader peptidase (prepilin peptidase)/N-methyltransferase
MGGLWAASYYFALPQSPLDWVLLSLQLYLMFVLVVTTMIDLDWRIIPDLCTMPLLAFGILLAAINPSLGETPGQRGIQCLAGVFIGGGVPWLMSMGARLIAGKDGVGWGDIKLLAAYGSLLGWKVSVGVYVLACFLGGVPAIAGLLTGKLKRHHYIPFGPFLNLALLLIFFGHHQNFLPAIANLIYQFPVEN